MAFVVKICLKCWRKWKYWRTPLLFFADDLCEIRPFETQIGMETDAKKHLIQATSHLRSRGNFLRILLLLSGNVERNPGPVSNYTLDDVNLCGFYKAALYFGFSHRKLIPVESEKQIQETSIGVKRVLDQGLNELQDKKKKTYNFFTDRLSQVMDEQFSAHLR